MSRIEPLPLDAVPELETAFKTFEQRMGFRANSGLIMARRPGIVQGLAQLASAVYDRESGTVPFELKNCICQIASWATGCLYCQAHFANNVLNAGVASDKLENLWDFENSPLFTQAERVALRFTLAAAQIPNAVTDELFDEMRRHWDDGQIVEILATACYTAFLNRWNDSLATTLEERPARVAAQHLEGTNWSAGKHAPGGG
jgi:alkylhydroperoxidase family enzyme